MSDQSAQPGGTRIRTDYLLIGGFVALAIMAALYVMSGRQQALRASPTGLDGLQAWLAADGQSVQSFTGGWSIDQNGVGLLVVPIYDAEPGTPRAWPQTKEELLFQQDEYDIEQSALMEKRALVPTLVVLPKWRSGVRLTGIGHPALLSDPARITKLAQRVTGDDTAALVRARVPFLEFNATRYGGTAKIYAAQMLRAPDCTPVIGRAEAMLLARCPVRIGFDVLNEVLVLSDPDLLNNHGLRLGDNAEIVRALFAELAQDRNIIIDYSADNWLFDADRSVERERSWSDLAKFFAPPFTILWVALITAFGLVLWRAAIRFGPVIDTARGMSASKIQAVAARARLMRLSNQDGAMLADYAAVRIATLGAQIFGPSHARHYASEENFLRYVQRRHPQYATPLAEALNNLRQLPHRVSATRALAEVDELERVLEHIANDT